MDKEILDRHLQYNQDTGIFTWINIPERGKSVKGTAAGTIHKGYVLIYLFGRSWSAHRLAHLTMTGKWPDGEIDHINRLPYDNRWVNLRDVSHQVNLSNVGIPKNNTSGYKGVRFNRASGKWRAEIHYLKKTIYLGEHNTLEEAIKDRLQGEQLYYKG